MTQTQKAVSFWYRMNRYELTADQAEQKPEMILLPDATLIKVGVWANGPKTGKAPEPCTLTHEATIITSLSMTRIANSLNVPLAKASVSDKKK